MDKGIEKSIRNFLELSYVIAILSFSWTMKRHMTIVTWNVNEDIVDI